MSHESQKQENELSAEHYEVLPRGASNEHNYISCNQISVDLNGKATTFSDCLLATADDNYIQILSHHKDKTKYATENIICNRLTADSNDTYLQLISDANLCRQVIRDANDYLELSTNDTKLQGPQKDLNNFQVDSKPSNDSLQAKVSADKYYLKK